jgi:hypothetical protein
MFLAPIPGLKVSATASIAPYRASGVHFDGSTSVQTSSLIAPADPTVFSCSVWFNSGGFPPPPNYQVFFVTDPAFAYSTFGGVWNNTSQNPKKGFVEMFDSNGANVVGCFSSVDVTDGQWHNIIFCGTTNSDPGTTPNQIAMYVDDQLAVGSFSDNGPYAMAFNGLPFWVGDDGFGFGLIGDMADLWIAPGVSLLDENGIIPEATRRLFISDTGKPVRPTSFPAGTVLLSGDKDTFWVNQGSGGAFTVSGTLTDASTSPSD